MGEVDAKFHNAAELYHNIQHNRNGLPPLKGQLTGRGSGPRFRVKPIQEVSDLSNMLPKKATSPVMRFWGILASFLQIAAKQCTQHSCYLAQQAHLSQRAQALFPQVPEVSEDFFEDHYDFVYWSRAHLYLRELAGHFWIA